jgi:hypothetical protein
MKNLLYFWFWRFYRSISFIEVKHFHLVVSSSVVRGDDWNVCMTGRLHESRSQQRSAAHT